MPEVKNFRTVWIDYAKAIGILLVIIGHITFIKPSATVFIYAFHMPLFFLISGYLHKNVSNIGNAVKKDSKRLLLPYCYFYIISYCYWFAVVYLKHKSQYPGTGLQEGLIKPFLGFLLGVGYDTTVSTNVNTPLWFLAGLFFVKLLYNLLCHIVKGNKIYLVSGIAVLLAIAVTIRFLGYDLWFSLDSAVLALPFFYAGVLLQQANVDLWFGKRTANFFYFLLFTAATWLLAMYNGRADINDASYGYYLPLFYLAGLCGTFMIFCLSFYLSGLPNKMVSFIAANTLILMCMQSILKSIAAGVLKAAGYLLPAHLNFIQSFVITLSVLVLSTPVIYIIDKYFPFLTGVPKRTRH